MRQHFETMAKPKVSNHSITFIANSGKTMDSGETVDLPTLRVYTKNGDTVRFSELENAENVDCPLLLDHMPSIEAQIGTVTSLELTSEGLIATAKLAHVPEAERVYELAKDGILNSSFSVTIECERKDYKNKTYYNSRLVEISVVYRGNDSRAVLKSANALTQKEDIMDKLNIMNKTDIGKLLESFALTADEKDQLTTAINDAWSSAGQTVNDAVDDVSEDTDTEDMADDTETPAEPDEAPAQNSKKVTTMPTQHAIVHQNAYAKVKNNDKTWLDSKDAFNQFERVLIENDNQSPERFKEAWAATVSDKMHSFSISAEDVNQLVPQAVLDTINDVYNTAGTLYPLLNKTGLDVHTVGYNDNDLNAADGTGRAHGYPVADYGTQKKEQKITLKSRKLEADMVYKYNKLNRGDLKRTRRPGALLSYVLAEIPNRLVQTIESQVVLGQYADMAQYISVLSDAADTQGWATEFTPSAGQSLLESLSRATSKIRATGGIYLVTSRELLAEAQWSKDASGQLVYPFGADLAGAMGYAGILTPEWFAETADPTVAGVALVPSAYEIVGETSPESFTNFALRTNEDEFMAEIFQGGGLAQRGGAVVIRTGDES